MLKGLLLSLMVLGWECIGFVNNQKHEVWNHEEVCKAYDDQGNEPFNHRRAMLELNDIP